MQKEKNCDNFPTTQNLGGVIGGEHSIAPLRHPSANTPLVTTATTVGLT